MGQAGYAQSGMVSFMRKLERQGTPPEFLSTHPSPGRRVQDLEGRITPAQRNGDGLDTAAYQAQIKTLK
jgi:predicted Zn-dependent protease